jgi:8-oxo-dGTP diphosphatase
MVQKVTLVFCLDKDGKILLGRKKTGHGTGYWNGYGGKCNPNESLTRCAIRELHEESGLQASETDLKYATTLHIWFGVEYRFVCQVYLLHRWHGESMETEEMYPRWFPLSELPVTNMWPGDWVWVPRILRGETIGSVHLWYNHDGTVCERHELLFHTARERVPH